MQGSKQTLKIAIDHTKQINGQWLASRAQVSYQVSAGANLESARCSEVD